MNYSPNPPQDDRREARLIIDESSFDELERPPYGKPIVLDMSDPATITAYKMAAGSVMTAEPGTLSKEDRVSDRLITDLQQRRVKTFAYKDGDNIVAAISVEAGMGDDELVTVRISDLFSIPEARSKAGLGRGLLEAALRATLNAEIWHVDLYAYASNTHAIEWYKRWGFQLAATDDPSFVYLSLWGGKAIQEAAQRLKGELPPIAPAS